MEANSTREKIIELARSLMQQIGYHSFNYKQIAMQLGIRNASIHHYFPLKEDLAIAVIEKDKADFISIMNSMRSLKPSEKADAFLAHYGNFFKDGRKLCVIGTFGFAFNDLAERIQMAISSYVTVTTQTLTEIFREGLASGAFSFNRTPEEMAADWAAALPGSLAIGRMLGSDHFRQMMVSLRKALNEK